eukprot:754059-Hanusia_phi.AAC.6
MREGMRGGMRGGGRIRRISATSREIMRGGGYYEGMVGRSGGEEVDEIGTAAKWKEGGGGEER